MASKKGYKKALNRIEKARESNEEELHLVGLELESLPAELFNLSDLRSLSLDHNKLTSLPIEIGNLDKLTSLSLDHNKLTSLPIEIGNLDKLTSLSLNDNRLTPLPIEIGNLDRLTSLSLGGNQLESLPAELFNLSELTSLSLNNNELTSLPIEIGNLDKLTSLSLASNQLESLPAELFNLSELTSLSLNNNKLTSLPIKIGNLDKLTSLSLGGIQLESLPAELFNLSKLTSLSLNNNKLTSLPIEIGNLDRLTSLGLGGNQLESLPAELFNLDKLSSLSLDHNKLKSLPIEIGNLDKLTSLSLNNNRLTSLPIEIGNLDRLTSLSLGGNQLESLPAELFNLSELKSLYLNGNELTTLPAEIGKLDKLKTLHLSDNQLKTLPAEIGKLTRLTYFRVQNNRLDFFPAEIVRLSNMDIFYFGGNEFTSMPKEISKLTRLRMVGCSGSENLSIVPPEIGELSQLHYLGLRELPSLRNIPKEVFMLPLEPDFESRSSGIAIDQTPLESPPLEIAKQGREVILAYFDEIEKEGFVQLFEAKLLVVGQGGVGKTFLVNRLIHGDPERQQGSTLGIDIEPWEFEFKEIDFFKANVWDFGGQVIYHATHQFFLTKRSLYLFVWDGRTDADLVNFDYWLNTVRVLTGDSPVFVIQGKIDERKKSINQEYWEKMFPNIVEFHDVSAKTGDGISTLEEAIKREFEKLPHIGDRLPKRWMKIRKKIERVRRNYISYAEYKKICREFELNEQLGEWLSTYYHDLGVFLHFKDNPILKNTIFIKPEWATNAVYKVIDSVGVQENFGRFCFEDLSEVWDDPNEFPPDMHLELVELMKSFELCFELPTKNEYIIPELLRAKQPDKIDWNSKGALKFKYVYEFMPAGIITRFIVKAHNLIEEGFYWKDGVILKWENTRARVIKSKAREIEVEVVGASKKSLLGIIRNFIDEIHAPFTNLILRELLPCICEDCSNAKDPYFHEFHNLLKAQEKKRSSVDCQISWESVEIEAVFGNAVRVINPLKRVLSRLDDLEASLKRGQDEIKQKQRENLQSLYNFMNSSIADLAKVGIPSGEVMVMIAELQENQDAQTKRQEIIDRKIVDVEEAIEFLEPCFDQIFKDKMDSFDTGGQKALKWAKKVLLVNLFMDIGLDQLDFSVIQNWIKKD